MWYCAVAMPGFSARSTLKRSSQNGMVWMMPFDLVADGHRLPRPLGGAGEGVAHDPVDAEAGEDRFLERELVVGALVEAAADLGIFALVVLADDQHVDVARLLAGERRRHAIEQADRPDIGVLLEVAPDRHQQRPQRHRVRHRRPADGAEEDRVMAGDAAEAVLRHHPAEAGVVIAAPVEFVPGDAEAPFAAGGVDDAHALRDHFLADSVARNNGDARICHGRTPRTFRQSRRHSPAPALMISFPCIAAEPSQGKATWGRDRGPSCSPGHTPAIPPDVMLCLASSQCCRASSSAAASQRGARRVGKDGGLPYDNVSI